ncbi:MAG: hypothetical protein FVQ82_01750 [Planctomycetes bacterium]|nr:hypothetical protein [Planctomycetota bacterium]
MLKIRLVIVLLFACGFAVAAGAKGKTDKSKALTIVEEGEKLVVKAGDVDLVTYQNKPMANPKGGDKFKGSNFIHPLKTLSGFTLTDLQPGDHLHHFGLWWPWKFLKAEGRKVLYWELQKGEGVIQAQGRHKAEVNKGGAVFAAPSHYIDKTAPDGPKVILKEMLIANVSPIVTSPAKGYFLDLIIVQNTAIKTPVEVVKYRYSGFSVRGAKSWNKDNSKLVTSAGKDRQASNFTIANWIIAEGDAKPGAKAGFVMMSHPDNYGAPQMLRTWNDKMHNGATFANFNPVQKKSWILEPGKKYIQKYRLFVYDGSITESDAQKMWSDYSKAAPAAKTALIPLPVELPAAIEVGTPPNLSSIPNLENIKTDRPIFYVPAGTKNVALNKTVTSSDDEYTGETLVKIVDGDMSGADESFLEFGPYEQYVTIDLGSQHEIYAVMLWHFHKKGRVYFDVVVQTSDDPDFITNVKTLFNNDTDNTHGLGAGKDKNYIETHKGKLINGKGTKARYVRCYSNANNANDLNHYIEVAVFGKPAK